MMKEGGIRNTGWKPIIEKIIQLSISNYCITPQTLGINH